MNDKPLDEMLTDLLTDPNRPTLPALRMLLSDVLAASPEAKQAMMLWLAIRHLESVDRPTGVLLS